MQRYNSFLWAAVAAVTLGGSVAAQQAAPRPGEPDPTDRGGEFTMTGCLTRPAAEQQQGPVFVITNVTSVTGEGRMVGGMGAGVPTPGQTNPAPHTPPDIVDDEYRVVADDADIDLASHVDRKVEMRGQLMTRDSDAQRVAGKATRTFMADEVRRLADTCQ